MLGAIAGDIIGSYYEFHKIKTKEFKLFHPKSKFTDDTTLSMAIAKSLLDNEPYLDNVVDFGLRYFEVGYGGSFKRWLKSENHEPYNSWGNGSAMRVNPIAWAFDTEEKVLEEARKSAEITHNHPEGIKGAEATALAIFMARNGATKEAIREQISTQFGYDLKRTVDEIRPDYKFEVSCQKSVPESIICFLDSNSFEDCIRNCVSLGGDADTMGAIASGIAEAYYGIPEEIEKRIWNYLSDEFREILKRFQEEFILRSSSISK
ncbi:MAG: ADP-ribosylglycohydrolase family protein [Epsilonproteobacteria bacterium]|nr:ADP-ribosylglycohydrolase family protein [Campylobacterota bacterium]